MPTLIDPNRTIFDGLVAYKGLPAPMIWDCPSRKKPRGYDITIKISYITPYLKLHAKEFEI